MTAEAPALLDVRGLRKVFRGSRGAEVVAVDDVSFTLAKGESLAVVGESGSGKTTVARMLVGLVPATSGSIAIGGVERVADSVGRRERRARAREMQLVFQDPYGSLDPRQGVQSAIGEILRQHHGLDKRAAAARVSELLDQVGLDERAGKALPRNLSGGQRQRVVIARSLAAEPEILILDEAVAALDVSVQAQILNLLTDIRERTQVAYLFISHDLAVVRQIAERAMVMRNGKIVEAGSTDQLLDAPEHPYTKELRAAVPGPGWAPRRRPAGAVGAE